ncbi:sulfotransferase [Ketobacter sp. MCCC 1A13808]|mgnify:CR=1 FL=1|uniref:sulfotransferase family protein n=1 Tax=Ketobacter sp. MCCC 1A13808 TaxID=2602738 RepID=UPI000F18FABF|nr:sulfotransferase [Ketobacter sp. MCCC 1A13808]MVF13960.1 sulfotransferase [Ketobacter sp. MCCC 1A13808]RLP53438.1 MAG: sulfotransferase [Ketobacter sp.]
MTVKALYIMSSPRGGSTLVSLVLGQHAKTVNLGEVCFIPKLLSLDEMCTCGQQLNQCGEWAKVFTRLAAASGVDMRAKPYGLHLDDAMKWKDGSGKIDHQRQTKARVAIARWRVAADSVGLALPPFLGGSWVTPPSIKDGVNNTMKLYTAAAEEWNSDLVVDASKLPRKAVHLYRAFPDEVRILHLTRDGRGVSASRMGHMPFERAAERWHHYHQLTTQLLGKWVDPAHRFSMQYEAFTSEPEKWTSQLCEWLNIEYDPNMLQFSNDSVYHSAGGNPTRFKLAEEGIRPTDDQWRSRLTADHIARFDAVAGQLNHQLGYQ